MPARKDPIYYALKPFKYLFLFSTSASSLGPTDLLVSSVWYRCYLVLFCTISTFLVLYVVLNGGPVTLSPFNVTTLYFYYWILQFTLLISPLMNSKKMRVQKILREFENLDSKIRFRYSEEVEQSRTTVIVIIADFVYHIAVHALVVSLFIAWGIDFYVITLSHWFVVLEFGVDIELLSLGSLLLLLCHRCDYFASHLNDLLEKRVDDTDLNLLLCHRQLHYVLKKINKAFKVKVTIFVSFITMLSLRNLVLVLWLYKSKLLIYSAMFLVFRYILLLAVLGAIGQRIANAFDRIHLLATNIRISSQINSDISCRRGAAMCVEGELRGKRLCGCGGLVVNAELPLRMMSALVTILVFIFSIKIDMSSI